MLFCNCCAVNYGSRAQESVFGSAMLSTVTLCFGRASVALLSAASVARSLCIATALLCCANVCSKDPWQKVSAALLLFCAYPLSTVALTLVLLCSAVICCLRLGYSYSFALLCCQLWQRSMKKSLCSFALCCAVICGLRPWL